MDKLPPLLGRFYHTSGTVIHGEKRGRTIGFPTANIDTDEEYILPPTGVYAVKFKIASTGNIYNGVCNVGYKPTFHKEQADKPSVEVYIFDFAGDLYGEKVTVIWFLRLRSEMKFAGVDELKAQIEKDKQTTKDYFEKTATDTCILS